MVGVMAKEEKGRAPQAPKTRGGRASASEVAERLTRTRIALGYPRVVDFVKATGFRHGTYTQWELGTRRITVDDAIRLVDRFHLTLDWIYLGDPEGLKRNLYVRLVMESAPAMRSDGADN